MSTITRTITTQASGCTVFGDLIQDGAVQRYEVTMPGVGLVAFVQRRTEGCPTGPSAGWWVTLAHRVLRDPVTRDVAYFATPDEAVAAAGEAAL